MGVFGAPWPFRLTGGLLLAFAFLQMAALLIQLSMIDPVVATVGLVAAMVQTVLGAGLFAGAFWAPKATTAYLGLLMIPTIMVRSVVAFATLGTFIGLILLGEYFYTDSTDSSSTVTTSTDSDSGRYL